jgi:hypothetical protein
VAALSETEFGYKRSDHDNEHHSFSRYTESLSDRSGRKSKISVACPRCLGSGIETDIQLRMERLWDLVADGVPRLDVP